MDEYSVTYRSAGAGLQTWECLALTRHDAVEKFVEFAKRYTGNRFAKNSITSVDRVEHVADE
jgi:hypothetical protein